MSINMRYEYQKYMLYCASYLFSPPQDLSQRGSMFKPFKQFGQSLVWACNSEQVHSKINSMYEVGAVTNCTVKLCPSNTVDITEYSQLLYCEQLPVESAVTTTNDYTTHPLYLKEVKLLTNAGCVMRGSTGTVISLYYDFEGEPIGAVVHIGVWSIAVDLKDIELCKPPIETTPLVVVPTKHYFIGKEVEILISAWEKGLCIGGTGTVIDVIYDDKGQAVLAMVDLGTKNENEGFPGLPNTSIQPMYIGHVRLPK